MPMLRLSVINAQRKPLPDVYDVDVTAMNSGTVAAMMQRVDETKNLEISGLPANMVYQLRVFPFRHRPVSQFVSIGGGATGRVEVACLVSSRSGAGCVSQLRRTAGHAADHTGTDRPLSPRAQS